MTQYSFDVWFFVCYPLIFYEKGVKNESLWVKCRVSLSMLFNALFKYREVNIQFSEQKLNWDFTTEFYSKVFWSGVR